MNVIINYAIGTIMLTVASLTNNIPIAIQGLAIVIWASSENIRKVN